MTYTRYKDISGQRFGKLTVIRYVGKDNYNNALWECTCDCGNTTVVSTKGLRSGGTKSCGCLHKSDLKGKRFGRLTVIGEVGTNAHRNVVWRCRCDCGSIVDVSTTNLVSGKTKSCGCLMRETAKSTQTTHGKSGSRLYIVWEGMKARCTNKNHKAYPHYGGRGITVCNEWLDFATFEKWSIDNGYDAYAKRGDCTIDRINVDGNYEPSNCRWVDMKVQANNKRSNNVNFKGKGVTTNGCYQVCP